MAIPAIRQWPMLRVFVPFASGICVQYYFPLSASFLAAGFIVGILLPFGFNLLSSKLQFTLHMAAGFVMVWLIFVAGMLVLFFQHTGSGKSGIPPALSGGKLYVRLIEEPVRRGKTLKANAEMLEYRLANKTFRILGSIQLTFLADSTLTPLSIGHELLITKSANQIADNSNPGGFNFKEYSLRQGLTQQIFLTKKDFTITGRRVNLLDRFLISIRKFIIASLQKYIPGKEEAGLAEALLIGYKNDLDKGLIQSYSNTGVVHVIAISGLHLALIYWIIAKLCDLLKLNKKLLKPIIVISGLWIFTLLAGASPSVVRSAVMFTVIVAGETIQRKAAILNSLAASAFLLLCYNPFWLWDLGFQLSYIAVLSLVLYAKRINNVIYIRNPMLSNMWNLVSVTLAAQVLTTPLTLLQFHKFPMLFLFTNCICVPLSSLILLGELLLCSLSWLNTPAEWIGIALYNGLKFMNLVVRFFEKFPFSNFQPVQISIVQTIILYACIALVMQWLVSKRKHFFFLFCSAAAAFAVLRMIGFYQCEHQSKLIIYNVPGKMAIDIFEGRIATCFQFEQKQLSVAETNQHLRNSRINNRIHQDKVNSNFVSGTLLFSNNTLRIVSVSQLTTKISGNDQPVDILLVSDNALLKSMPLINGLKVRMVVADATNSRASLQQYRKFFESNHIPYHSVSEQGAFVRNLN